MRFHGFQLSSTRHNRRQSNNFRPHIEALERRVRVPFANEEIWVLTEEDIALFKLVYGRTKDFADLERLFAARRDRLDYGYLERWVGSMFAPDDQRRRRFEDLVRQARA